MKKTFKKAITLLLTLTLIVSMLPLQQVFAEESAVQSSKTETLNQVNSEIGNDTEQKDDEEPYIISEVVEKRDEFTKYFLMSDKSYMAATYKQPIHYKNNDVWENIDNSFTQTKDSESKSKQI